MSFNGAGKITFVNTNVVRWGSHDNMDFYKRLMPPLNPNKPTTRECEGCGAPRVMTGPCEYYRRAS